jgi:predicted nucleotidyltransferase
MEPLTVFAPELARLLPETYALLQAAHLVVHPSVGRVVLTGSRGVRGAPRPDSDVDLCLVVAGAALPAEEPAREQLLRVVVETTLSAWRRPVECDLAAVYDERGCGLICFSGQRDTPPECPGGGSCRFGIYKLQKGFAGDVPWAFIELPKVYPLLEIWRRQGPGGSLSETAPTGRSDEA